MKTQHIACAVLVASAIGAHAKDATYIGSVEAVPGDKTLDLAQGTVFLDLNRNSRFDSNETGLPGVIVSNGREVV
ncbi:MAG: hypothetical protein OXN84_05515, partial [Albidovulum sp.]|nr:hypothetical protein [Albidovulum sp.]